MTESIFLLFLGSIMLYLGSEWIVKGGVAIAEKYGICTIVIGLTVVAFGTSAPEFAVTIRAAITGQTDISIGNVVGSNIFNLGFILGGTAMIRAINITPKLLYRDGFFLLSVTLLIYFLFFGLNDINTFPCQSINATMETYIFFFFN